MSISTLTIRSFKSIVDLQLSLGAINIFIGSNGSGKSNILEAAGVLSAAVSGRVDDESLLRRGVRPGVPRLYKSAFSSDRLAPHVYFDAETEHAKYTVSLNNTLEKPRPAWHFKTEEFLQDNQRKASRGPRSKGNKEFGMAPALGVDLKEGDGLEQLLGTLRNYGIYSPNTPTLRGLQPDAQNRAPVGLSGGGLAEAVHELLLGAVNDDRIEDFWEDLLGLIDWVADLETTSSASDILSASVPRTKRMIRFTDRYMRKGKNTLTGYDASEGALYVLFFGVLALHPEVPDFLAVDNMDQAMNPRLVRGLLSLLCRWLPEARPSQQLLFTLHNPAALDGLPLEDDRIRLFAVDRNSNGHTSARRIVVDDRLRALAEEKGWPLSRLWVMGHLGGVPNV